MNNSAFYSGATFTSRDVDKLIHALLQKGRGWNMTAQVYTQAAPIPRVDNCFAFMFTNIGDVTATVNGIVIFPNVLGPLALGDSRTLSGHLLDMYKGLITLSFENPTTGTVPRVEIVQLYYVDGIFEITKDC